MPSSTNVLLGRPDLKLIDKRACLTKRGGCASALYIDIAKGLWPAPTKIGPRGSRWVEHEADAILAARIAGKSDDEIRALVQDLHARRQTDFATLRGVAA